MCIKFKIGDIVRVIDGYGNGAVKGDIGEILDVSEFPYVLIEGRGEIVVDQDKLVFDDNYRRPYRNGDLIRFTNKSKSIKQGSIGVFVDAEHEKVMMLTGIKAGYIEFLSLYEYQSYEPYTAVKKEIDKLLKISDNFLLDDISEGMILEFFNGDKYFVAGNFLIGMDGMSVHISKIDDDFKLNGFALRYVYVTVKDITNFNFLSEACDSTFLVKIAENKNFFDLDCFDYGELIKITPIVGEEQKVYFIEGDEDGVIVSKVRDNEITGVSMEDYSFKIGFDTIYSIE